MKLSVFRQTQSRRPQGRSGRGTSRWLISREVEVASARPGSLPPPRCCSVCSERPQREVLRDRKSTRLNSSHEWISYAVFCLKKKRRIDAGLLDLSAVLCAGDRV